MNKYILLVVLLLIPVSFSSAYTPWNPKDAGDDVKYSDIILIGRVTKLERKLMDPRFQDDNCLFYDCIATINVGKILKGKTALDGRTTIEIHIGTTVFNYEGDLSRIDMRKFETEPTDMTIAMTQASYDLRFNKVYLLYLSKNTNETGTETGFNPRTGPYSIGWITKDSKLVKNDKGRREIVSNKYISMGAGGGSWAKKIPLDDYLKNLKVTE